MLEAAATEPVKLKDKPLKRAARAKKTDHTAPKVADTELHGKKTKDDEQPTGTLQDGPIEKKASRVLPRPARKSRKVGAIDEQFETVKPEPASPAGLTTRQTLKAETAAPERQVHGADAEEALVDASDAPVILNDSDKQEHESPQFNESTDITVR